MIDGKLAMCCTPSDQKSAVVCCSCCGKCGDCTLHAACTINGQMVSPIVGSCSNDSCINNTNSMQTLVCSFCGKCGDCTFHSHST